MWWFPLLAVLAAVSDPGVDSGCLEVDLATADELLEQGQYEKADAEASQRLTLVEEACGPESWALTQVLDRLIRARARGKNARAQETLDLAMRNLALKRKLAPTDDVEIAETLVQIGIIYWKRAEYDPARRFYGLALEARTRAFGPDHPKVASVLNNLGVLHLDTGELEAAQAYYERALAIKEAALPPDHPQIAASLNNMGVVANMLGDHVRARALYEQALAIKIAAYGENHPQLATTLGGLAQACEGMHDYQEALALAERSFRLREQTLGPDHPRTAVAAADLATLTGNLGNVERAVELQQVALDIFNARMPDHPITAKSHHNLSNLFTTLNRADDALKHSLRAAEIFHEHDLVLLEAHALSTQGKIHLELLQQPKRAIDLLERSIVLKESYTGDDARLWHVTWNRLGNAWLQTGEPARALPILQQALAATPELDLMNLAAIHGSLSMTYLRSAEPDLALTHAVKAEDLSRSRWFLAAPALPEPALMRFAARRGNTLDLLLSAVQARSGADTVATAWNAVIRSRALSLEELATRTWLAARTDDPRIGQVVSDIVEARTFLSQLMLRGPTGDPASFSSELDAGRARREEMEKELAALTAGARPALASCANGLDSVQAALGPGDALLAYVRYRRLRGVSAKALPATEGASTPAVEFRYAAFLQEPGGAQPVYVPLLAADVLDGLVRTWRDAALDALAGDTISASQFAQYQVAGTLLRQAVWDPLSEHLAGIDRLYLVPDGSLNGVNFDALPTGTDTYLLETAPLFHYLAMERDLAPCGRDVPPGVGLLALGDPDYDLVSGLEPRDLAAAGPTTDGAPRLRSACRAAADLSFGSLPGTAAEIDQIARVWEGAQDNRDDGQQPPSLTKLRAAGASERAFKSHASGKRVLHLATHGFFLGGGCAAAPASTRGVGGLSPAVASARPLLLETPLLLSGLALAGANRDLEAASGFDDGLLTAEEIAGLDLTGVEWAVLSACDTGQGTLQSFEGLFGLRRAFRIAGADHVIMSIWPVNDEATREWMTALYEARWRDGLETAAAVRDASRRLLRRRREEGTSTHPAYWGAFLAVSSGPS